MELSLVAGFDDLRRCDDILTDGTAEIGKAAAVATNDNEAIAMAERMRDSG